MRLAQKTIFLASLAMLSQFRTSWAEVSDSPQRDLRTWLASIASKRQILVKLAIDERNSSDFLREVRDDLGTKRTVGVGPIEVRANGHVFSGGRKLGVQITEFAPVKIVFKGKSWQHNDSQPTEQNYRSLFKLLTVTSVAVTPLNWLIPIDSAYAAVENKEQLHNFGAGLNAHFTRCVMGTVSGSPVRLACLPASVITWLIQYVGGGNQDAFGKINPRALPGSSSQFKIACDGSKVSIQTNTKVATSSEAYAALCADKGTLSSVQDDLRKAVRRVDDLESGASPTVVTPDKSPSAQ